MSTTNTENMTEEVFSKSVESLNFGEVELASSFPIHYEIALPSNEISIEPSEVESHVSKVKPPEVALTVPDDYPQYAQIDIQTEPSSPSLSDPKSPTSIYAVAGSTQNPKIALKSREVSSRQCKFEIGEEWEQFQIRGNSSVSCPPSPLVGNRKHEFYSRTNPGYAASEPGAEIDQDLTDASEKAKDPFPFLYMFTSPSRSVKEHHIVPNPFNRVNHRFHSTLQCPCFLFFCFLCCLPAVHLMQQSDHQFKKGNRNRASNYGKVSTAMYIIGSLAGVAFLAVCIYFAADYVRQFL